MSMLKPSVVLLGLVLLPGAGNASAQGAVGGAFIVSRLPSADYVPGSLAVPPNGLTNGGVLFGGGMLSSRIGLQGEVSIPTQLVTLVQSSHPSLTIDDTTVHRDTIVDGLLRLRVASWCEGVVGGGLTFERTTVTTVTTAFQVGARTSDVSSSATRPTFTTGVDFPIRLSRWFALHPRRGYT